MTSVSLRIPDNLNNYLEEVAIEQERSKSFIIQKAIENYLEDLYDHNLIEEGYKRYLANGKKTYSLKHVAKRLKIDLDE